MLLIEINCKPPSDEKFSFLGKVVSPAMRSEITLTKNEMEYNLKVAFIPKIFAFYWNGLLKRL